MSRKNKIIVSVVGITIVLLALLGITYAYYLTRIQGNTNTNSISITTANLLLKYDDGSGAIVEENIMPGVTFTKTFSVTNEGNAKIDNYVVYLEEVINDLKRTEDLTYTLTCTSTAGDCAGGSGEYPKLAGIIATNSIEVGETHNYTLTVIYENLPNTDQSIDMGSRINGYIQIYNLQDIVDLTGSVTNAVDGDYVQINSVQKISQIVDGKYTLGAIEPGSHTITVRYIDENDEEQIRSTKTITIQKGETASVSGDTITVTNDSQTVNINIDATNADNTTINNTIKDYNPFNEGTLAYNIYKSAKENKNGLELLSTPKTEVGKEHSQIKETRTYLEKDWYYGDAADIYMGEGLQEGPVSKCTSQHIGQSLVANDSDYYPLGMIIDCDDNNQPIISTYISEENTLSYTSDDYGTSYYYRGGVENSNNVSFLGMCWKIIRIAGDGSVKLVLHDKSGDCINDYESDWNLGEAYYASDYPNSNFLKPKDEYKIESMAKKLYDFQNTLNDKISTLYPESNISDILKSGGWCVGDEAYSRSSASPYTYTPLMDYTASTDRYYDSYIRLMGDNKDGYQPTLKCNGQIIENFENVEYGGETIINNVPMYVGTITADEFVFSGGITKDPYNNDMSFYIFYVGYWSIVNGGVEFLTLSPSTNSNVFKVLSTASSPNGNYYYLSSTGISGNVRPVINLKSGVKIQSGDGSTSNPYVIDFG